MASARISRFAMVDPLPASLRREAGLIPCRPVRGLQFLYQWLITYKILAWKAAGAGRAHDHRGRGAVEFADGGAHCEFEGARPLRAHRDGAPDLDRQGRPL